MAVPTTGELNINIRFNGEGGEPTTEQQAGNPSAPTNIGKPNEADPTSAESGSLTLSAGVNVAMSLGKQAVNAAVSNIGLATGDNYAQSRTQGAISAISTVAALAMSVKNPLIFAATVGALVISGISQVYQNYKERQWENRRAAQYAVLYGFSSEEGR